MGLRRVEGRLAKGAETQRGGDQRMVRLRGAERGRRERCGVLADEPSMKIAGAKGWIVERPLEVVHIGADSEQDEFVERCDCARNRLVSVRAVNDEFRQHRIEIGRDRLPDPKPALET